MARATRRYTGCGARADLGAAAVVTAIVAGCAGLPADMGSCEFDKTESVTIDPMGADRLRIEAGAGMLLVEGEAGLDDVTVRANGCVSTEGRLDDLRLVTERSGGEVIVRSEFPEVGGGTDGRMDLVIRLPAGMHVHATDGSGDATVTGVGDLDFTDGSGSLDVRDAGRVVIRDGSGSVDVERVASLSLDDGSGSIDVAGVDGPAAIHDGSGSIEVEDVGGDLDLDDGSGSIRVARVGGEVHLRDGSGSMRVSDVGGSVELTDGSGDVHLARIEGDLTIHSSGSGGLELEEIAGTVRGAAR